MGYSVHVKDLEDKFLSLLLRLVGLLYLDVLVLVNIQRVQLDVHYCQGFIVV